jgi:hypothetical protein
VIDQPGTFVVLSTSGMWLFRGTVIRFKIIFFPPFIHLLWPDFDECIWYDFQR